MNRNVNELTEKARTHKVFSGSKMANFVVESGSSGRLYRVRTHANGLSYFCECQWNTHNENSECSHVLAVRLFVARVKAASMPSVEIRADGVMVLRQ